MNNSGLQLFVELMNLASGLVFFYCLFSIPAQTVRRFRLKRQGKAVSPMLLIIRKLLKYWFFSALILIPFALIVSYLALSEGGLSSSEVFVALVTQVFIGNIGTALLFGYVFMKANKASWSYSAREEKISGSLERRHNKQFKFTPTAKSRPTQDSLRSASAATLQRVIFQKESSLQNQPMNSGDQGKLLIFSLLMAPSIIFLFGVIPAIFLGFGIYMMQKNQDFSSIDTAVKNFKSYTWLALIGCALSSLYWGYKYFSEENSWYYDDEFFVSLMFAGIAFSYLIAVQVLFYSPMNRHRQWVEVNGIFATKLKSDKSSANQSEVDIIKGEKLKQYSVADELLKWAKLKEDGHISEEEFNEARIKLLKRN